ARREQLAVVAELGVVGGPTTLRSKCQRSFCCQRPSRRVSRVRWRGSFSMPVQGGPGSPLGYASSQAPQAGTGGSTASPLRELQIVTSLGGYQDPGASLDMPSSRNALPSRSGTSLLDALSSQDGLASRNALPSRDTPPLRPTLLPGPPLAPAKTPI